jgi:hypothetical protein
MNQNIVHNSLDVDDTQYSGHDFRFIGKQKTQTGTAHYPSNPPDACCDVNGGCTDTFQSLCVAVTDAS